MVDLKKIKEDLNEFFADDLAVIRDNVKWEKDDDDFYTLKRNEEYSFGLDVAYGNVGAYFSHVLREEINKLIENDSEYYNTRNMLIEGIIEKVNEENVTDINVLVKEAEENIGDRGIMAKIKYFNIDLISKLENLSPIDEIDALIQSMRIYVDFQYYEPALIIVKNAIYSTEVISAINNNK